MQGRDEGSIISSSSAVILIRVETWGEQTCNKLLPEEFVTKEDMT
jgi:hypothetical protein